MAEVSGRGTKDDPWVLQTPPGGSRVHGVPGRVARPAGAGLRGREDPAELPAALRRGPGHRCCGRTASGCHSGNADEQKPAPEGSVEAWGRWEGNPVGGWYGLKKGLRGRFATYVPPVLEHLGLAELEHKPRGNRMRAI